MNTPETDHLERNLGNAAHPVLSSFCRKLERERDEAREALKTGGMLNIIDRAAHGRAAAIRERDEARAEMIRWMSIAEGRGRTDDESLLSKVEDLKGTFDGFAWDSGAGSSGWDRAIDAALTVIQSLTPNA